jgi:hypothetical protein
MYYSTLVVVLRIRLVGVTRVPDVENAVEPIMVSKSFGVVVFYYNEAHALFVFDILDGLPPGIRSVGRPAFVSTFHIRPTVVLDQTSCTVQYNLRTTL